MTAASGDLMENLDGTQPSGAGTGKKPALAEAGDTGEELNVAPEVTSKKAIGIVNRVRDKLTGQLLDNNFSIATFCFSSVVIMSMVMISFHLSLLFLPTGKQYLN